MQVNDLKLSDRNLLEDWYLNNAFLQTDKERVDFVYITLKLYFGIEFFHVKAGTDMPLNDISWIFGLLASKEKKECFFALLDISLLIGYLLKKLPLELQKEAEDLKKNPLNLRTFFYELFVYRLLDANGLTNLKKPKIGNQVVEGTCRIDGVDYLYECRKIFIPRAEELDIIRRMLENSAILLSERRPKHPMICTVNFQRPVTGAHLSVFLTWLKQLLNSLDSQSGSSILETKDVFSKGSFEVKSFDKNLLDQIKSSEPYNLLFYCFASEDLSTSQPLPLHYRMTGNFPVPHNDIYKKLESVFKEKRNQHRNSPFPNRIFFFDNEVLPEFQMNLFPVDGMYDLERIKSIHRKLGMTEIVCFTKREYGQYGPIIEVDVITPPGLVHMEQRIKQLFAIMDGNNRDD